MNGDCGGVTANFKACIKWEIKSSMPWSAKPLREKGEEKLRTKSLFPDRILNDNLTKDASKGPKIMEEKMSKL